MNCNSLAGSTLAMPAVGVPNNAGGAVTLNIDTLGAVPVKLPDGATDPGPLELPAGRMRDLWYDGTVFRFRNAAVPPPNNWLA